ncbi:ABC transporter ATP-binding protein [Cohnella cholangitidis]|uniref:ABC transporter ATP-binding protein n=1 Tax=Cohnella cholangitidis TaxID=2598458 RepID=A0A7G5C0T3_9BACL|nr:ABC transporter ATP-binding protein [Cohnella cholangitidis]QMV42817.1 ABC transporter ATP-binding protein [Cohnella cholangitidis]
MPLFFRLIKKYRVAAIMAIALMLIELTVELVQPLLISKIIDDGIAKQDTGIVLLWSGVLVAGTLLAFGAGILSSFYAAHVSQSLGYDIREKLYGKVQAFSYAVFNRFATSSLITRLTNDVTQVQDTTFMGLRFMLRVPLVVVGSMIMALVVHAGLGFLLLLTVPALILFIIWIVKKAAVLFKTVQQRLDTVNGVMQENLTGMRLIRVFVRREQEAARFARHSGELMQSSSSALRLTEITLPFIVLIMNAGIIAVLWFGQLEIRAGSATTGEVVAIVNYSLRTAGALSALSMLVSAFSRAHASLHRINDALETDGGTPSFGDAEATGKSAGNVREGDVEFDRVTFQYPNTEAPVLEDVSFRVSQGETVAILGATGSGKSSLVQLLLRLYEEDKGSIRIDGRNVREWSIRKLHDSIGYVPQEVVLFTGTIRDNIAWGLEGVGLEHVMEAAKLAQIHDTIAQLPNGYDTLLGQRGVNLSGGQKQRLSIARALIRKPAILVLDDSTSALDVRTEAALLQAIRSLSCTTFLITQKISSTLNADLILLLDDGRLIAEGNHAQLMAGNALYRRIYESQFGEEGSHVGSAK